MKCFDSRTLSADLTAGKALWTLNAHDSAVSALDYSALIPGFLVTGGVDHTIKLWNVAAAQGNDSMQISLVTSRDLGVVGFSLLSIPPILTELLSQGKVFATVLSPDDPTTLAVAGSAGSVQIWDAATNAGVRTTFGDRLRSMGKDLERERKAILTVKDDASDEE